MPSLGPCPATFAPLSLPPPQLLQRQACPVELRAALSLPPLPWRSRPWRAALAVPPLAHPALASWRAPAPQNHAIAAPRASVASHPSCSACKLMACALSCSLALWALVYVCGGRDCTRGGRRRRAEAEQRPSSAAQRADEAARRTPRSRAPSSWCGAPCAPALEGAPPQRLGAAHGTAARAHRAYGRPGGQQRS